MKNQAVNIQGLYMVGKAAEILNIEIEVKSELNVGSEFSFIFKSKSNLTNM
mgnify:CR=1 FL=1